MNLLQILAPPLMGATLGACVVLGLVHAAEQPPDMNPAHQPILTYGD